MASASNGGKEKREPIAFEATGIPWARLSQTQGQSFQSMKTTPSHIYACTHTHTRARVLVLLQTSVGSVNSIVCAVSETHTLQGCLQLHVHPFRVS